MSQGQRREISKVVTSQSELGMVVQWVFRMTDKALAGGHVKITLGREKRTSDQNSKLWPMLGDVAKQVEWYGQKLSDEDWKHVFTASLTRQRVVPGIDGGFVVLGKSTSRMKKDEFSDLIELIYAFGAERGVQWSEKALAIYDEMMGAGTA